MRRLFVAARANPKHWAGLPRRQPTDHEILEEMLEDADLPAALERGQPGGAALGAFRLRAGRTFCHHPKIMERGD